MIYIFIINLLEDININSILYKLNQTCVSYNYLLHIISPYYSCYKELWTAIAAVKFQYAKPRPLVHHRDSENGSLRELVSTSFVKKCNHI